jgi:hypothetical protein
LALKQGVFLTGEYMSIKATITAHKMNFCDSIEQDAKVKYTGWYVLLIKTESGFESIGVFNPDVSEPETEPEWDLCLPIPEPESFRDFMGW